MSVIVIVIMFFFSRSAHVLFYYNIYCITFVLINFPFSYLIFCCLFFFLLPNKFAFTSILSLFSVMISKILFSIYFNTIHCWCLVYSHNCALFFSQFKYTTFCLVIFGSCICMCVCIYIFIIVFGF